MIDQPPEYCVASIYDTSEKWGKVTASGIPLDDNKLTMAHRTYKMRGFMKITNRKTGKVIIAMVTDRGPYHPDRCADLTQRSAKDLGIDGLGAVKVEPWSGK